MGFPPYQGMFQPTLPLRGATLGGATLDALAGVSTHAPLAGSDLGFLAELRDLCGFNPRSPCGERRF